jgi:hypothetical protein
MAHLHSPISNKHADQGFQASRISYLFICSLFNDAVSVTKTTASTEMATPEWWIVKNL